LIAEQPIQRFVRASPVALTLERVGAFAAPDLFELSMTVCACDYCAYRDRSGQNYPKAALLDAALRACAEVHETEFAADLSTAADAVRARRGDRTRFPLPKMV
jgi:tRNA nucleotidyltransferase (CCA-adding enzyme)